MKKLFLILLISSVPFVLGAQTNQGGLLIGTSTQVAGSPLSLFESTPTVAGFAYSSTKSKADEYESDADKYFSFNISPQIGYFIVDGLALGVTSNVAYLKYKEDEDALVSYAFGPLMRYYFNVERFKPFIQGSACFGQLRYSSDYKSNLSDYGGGAGVAFFVNDKVSIDMFAGYNHAISKDPNDDDNYRDIVSTFTFGFGVSIFL